MKRSLDSVVKCKTTSEIKEQKIQFAHYQGESNNIQSWNIFNIPALNQNGQVDTIAQIFKPNYVETIAPIKSNVFDTLFNETENKFESLIQSLEGVFWEADAKTFQFNYISPQVFNILGYTPTEWLGTSNFWQNHIFEDDREYAVKYCHQETVAGNNHVFEYRMQDAAGKIVWLRDIVSIIKFNDEPAILRGFMIDITEEKKKDEVIKKATQSLQNILNQSLDIICTIDKNGVFQLVSEASSRVLGYAPSELVGKNYIDFVYAADREKTLIAENDILQGNNLINFENRYQKKDGQIVPLIWTARWDKNDALIYCTAKDLTEKKRSDWAIRNLIFNTEESFLLLDKNLLVLTFNEQFSKLCDRYWGRTIKKGDYFIDYENEDRIEFITNIFKSVLEGKDETLTIEIPNFYNTKKVYSLKFKPAYDEDLESIGVFVTGADITEAEIAKSKIKNSEQQYKYLFENNPAPMFIWDFETKLIVDCNEAALIKYKYTRNEFIGMSILDIRPKEDIPLILDSTKSAESYNNTFNKMHSKVWRHLTKQGELLEVEIDGHILNYKNKKSALVIIQDVTERQKTERQIISSEEKYRTLFNSSPIPKCVYDLENFQILDVNEMSTLHYGYSREEFMQMSIFDLRVNSDELNNDVIHSEIMNNNGVINFGINTHKKKDGTLIKVDVRGYRFKYLNKSCIMALYNDVTEREILIQQLQQREKELIDINLRYVYVTKATNDAIWDFDVNRNYLFLGEGFNSLFGYDLGKQKIDFNFFMNCIHNNDVSRISSQAQKYMNDISLNFWFEEYRFKKVDGTYAFVIDRAIFIRDELGKVIRIVGAMTDISYQKEYEDSLKKLNDILDEKARQLANSNKELEHFAYIASHDLQEPLRMITSFLSQLDKKYKNLLDDKAKSYIFYAVDGAKRMRQIILDLLEFSRVGRIDAPKEKIDLNQLIDEIRLLFSNKIEETNAKVVAEQLPVLNGHISPLRQLFQNIIDNALIYIQPDKSPLVLISVKESSVDWEFCIADNGIGIEMEYFEKIFTIFQRLHGKNDYAGSGMGLVICKKIIENLGGNIWLESQLGLGSKFYFTIPK